MAPIALNPDRIGIIQLKLCTIETIMSDWDGFYIGSLILAILSIVILILVYKWGKRIKPLKLPHIVGWNFLLLIACLMLLFIGFETYYRFFVDTTDSFAISKITQRWGKRHYQFNNFNVRDNVDYPFKIQPQLRRVTIIGDSFTAGYGIEDVDDRFVNIIRKNLYDKEIHTISNNGYDTDHQFIYIKKFREQDGYEMDVLVLVYNLNDIAFFIPENEEIINRIYAYEKELNYFTENSYFLNEMFFKYMAMTDPEMNSYFEYLKDSYSGEPSWKKMQDFLGQIVDYCDTNNLQLMVVTFPFLHNFEDYGFTQAHQQLDKFWTSKGIKHLDLLPIFEQHKEENLVVNSFDAHPNENAHQIAAEAIGEFIESNVKDYGDD